MESQKSTAVQQIVHIMHSCDSIRRAYTLYKGIFCQQAVLFGIGAVDMRGDFGGRASAQPHVIDT